MLLLWRAAGPAYIGLYRCFPRFPECDFKNVMSTESVHLGGVKLIFFARIGALCIILNVYLFVSENLWAGRPPVGWSLIHFCLTLGNNAVCYLVMSLRF